MITFMQAAQGGGMSMLLMMAAIFAIMWFFMIRPQQKKQKEIQRFRDAITTGTSDVTAGGIYGIIKEVNETTFLVEVAKDIVIKIDKGSVYVAAEDAQQAQATNEKK